MKTRKSGFLAASLLLCAAFGSSQAQSGYHIINKITLGGEGGWDYLAVDPEARRLYVSHSIKVVVVDVETGKVVGEIPNTNGIHGIAIAHDLGRGFTSNGRDATVTIFDLKTLAIIGSAKTGGNPDAIMYEPLTKRVFAFNRVRASAEASTTVIDAAKGEVIKTVLLGGRPEFAVTDGKGTVFVNLDDKNEIAVIDAKELTIKARWSLSPGEGPSGLAMDAKKRRLFSVCENKKMIVMNADNGKVIAEIPIGAGTDGAAFDPGTGFAFSSNGGDGTLTVVHEIAPGKFAAETIKTQPGARTMTVDLQTHRLYLSTAEFGPPPAPTTERPNPRPVAKPGSFMVLVLGK
ncbi:MAG: YncE family protein [Acidobacteria bacterium]|nr:YncE family protein [Acidobacteriota bacterium]